MKRDWMERFLNPEAMDRSFLFWAWNGKLDEEEIRRQIREMKQAGVGGFFIHSRDGLETEYMGNEWMHCVRCAVEEAKKQGLFVWLYDEDRWPSGTAGGSVTKNKAFCCKGLTLELVDSEEYGTICVREGRTSKKQMDEETGLLAFYAAVIEGNRVMSYHRISTEGDGVIQKGETLFAVRLETSGTSQWFNGEAPPDNLNPACVRAFIKETHEKYKEEVGEFFGTTILGIFTDEPSLNDRHAYFGETKSWIPWTFSFSSYFQKRNGYDFFDVLPYFYFQGERSEKVRHDYWYAVTKRYGETYFKTIGKWCEENRLFFTGHFLQEDKMGLCARVNGAVMPNYQYQHVPGIDMLGEQTREYITVKQCTSVAHQLGKVHVLSETYGCTGWAFSLEGQKWMGDWQYILGVNHRCQHLSLYSLRGCRKRDYPPSFHYNNNSWKDNPLVEDYFARMSVVLEQGEAVRKILLLHPMSTVWSRLGVDPRGNPRRKEERDVPMLNTYGEQLNQLIEFLERHHLDCDLGDEILMKQYGKVENGSLKIGKASYQAVVIPHMDTMFQTTWDFIHQFGKQGGKVFFLGDFPDMIEGEKRRQEIERERNHSENVIHVNDWMDLEEKLEEFRTVTIQNGEGREETELLYQLRKDGQDTYLVLINNNRGKAVKATVSLFAEGEVYELDFLTGNIRKKECCRNGEKLQMDVTLEPTGSVGYLITEGDLKTVECTKEKERSKQEKVTRVERFSYSMEYENNLPLDLCRYRMGGGKYSPVMEVWQAQKEIREKLGMSLIHRNGQIQRYRFMGKKHPGDGTQIELEFSFESELEGESVWLILERMEEFHVTLNGIVAKGKKEGWFLDREWKKQFLGHLKKGINVLTLQCHYTNDMELENCYVMGRFGVNEGRKITSLKEEISVGDWTKQGLKHYCGSITYQVIYETNKEYDYVKMKLPSIQAVCIHVTVNGERWDIPWNFTRILDITKYIKPGKNQVEIEVVGSPRNMCGPFHIKEEPHITNDASFSPEEEEYSASYLLKPYGIMGPLVFYEGEKDGLVMGNM